MKNMLGIKKILNGTIAVACCALQLCGCVREEFSASDLQSNVAVKLNVGTRAVDASDGTPTTEESALHTLRVYAFVDGRLVGHEFRDKGMTAPAQFWMDLAMTSTTTEEVDFYLIANEAAMLDSGTPVTLTEDTKESALNSLIFTALNTVGTYGLPMFCKETQTVDFSQDSSVAPTDPDHADHTQLAGSLTFQLQRPVGKLGVFAAKDEGETVELKVTGLKMLKTGLLTSNYLMPQEVATLQQISGGAPEDIELTHAADAVTKTLAANITTEERTNPANYTAVLAEPYYPFENPWGSNDWSAPGHAKGNVLQIDYTFDGEARQGLVYMPAIERNHYYAVCCLMHNSGKITVAYNVAEWDQGGDYILDFAHPNFEQVRPLHGGTVPYPQPEVYYNNDAASTAGTYIFEFKITGPDGQEWTPTLFGATVADYELTVCQNGALVEPVNGSYLASPDAYEIRVRALKNDSGYVGKEFSLGIAFTPKWDPAGSSLLMINMEENGSTNWTGSDDEEKIVIKQVEPTK